MSINDQKILIVDDEPNIREVVELYLRREGYEVEVTGDGAAALEAIERKAPDLIVLDLMLPVLGGIQLTRTLREGHYDIPIIMLTSVNEHYDYRNQVDTAYFPNDKWLDKPVKPDVLLEEIGKLV